MKRILISFFLVVLTALSAMAQETFVSGGRNRTMIVYAPSNLPKNSPLLISMHGSNQSSGYQRSQADYESVADTAKFVVVYPDGEGDSNGTNRGWDLGSDKDINFILDIINEMYKRYGIDKNRVYLSGFSMGGMMTYYAMTKIADKIAAFAPVSGYNIGGPNANSSRPVPILHVHGTGDDVCSYSPVQSHINAWVTRNKCNSTPQVIKPYPAGSKTSQTALYRYRNGLNGVEVALLELPGKGHWHSNDPNFAMTNVEIWNFCKRYSLTPGPKLVKAEPEDGSFDMLSDANREFKFTFDKAVDCSKVKGIFTTSTASTTTTMKLQETGESKTLTFVLPESKTVSNGKYIVKVSGLTSTDGGIGGDVSANYVYGVEEVGDELNIDTLLVQDWLSQEPTIGEGIPNGWLRVNSKSDGSKDEKKQNEANTGGCRMKYFTQGGDFDAGFYLSAREFDRADFTYGTYTGKRIKMLSGKYIVSFNTIYWNTGARDSKNTITMSILNSTTNNAVASQLVTPAGCLSEISNQKVTGSAHHEVVVTVPSAMYGLLQFSMQAGWNGVIISEPMITTCPSNADIYKGGFQRTLKQANTLLASLEGKETASDPQTVKLKELADEYASFATISPSEYTAATEALKSAMEPVIAVGVKGIVMDKASNSDAVYDLTGRKVTGSSLNRGIYIRGGKKFMVK